MRGYSLPAILASFLGGVAGAVVGCNFIVDAGDYSVGDASSSSPDARSDAREKPDAFSDAGESADAFEDDNEDSSAFGGQIGDPCSGDGGCSVGVCNGQWCTNFCASPSDPSCGSNTQGSQQANDCVYVAANSNYECFPGCSTNFDCTCYSAATCQPTSGHGTVYVCSGTLGLIGDPCGGTWTACEGDGGAACNGDWCTVPCTSDTDCGTSSTGMPNYCVPTSDGGTTFQCTPGCATSFDCASYTTVSFCDSLDGGADGEGFCGN